MRLVSDETKAAWANPVKAGPTRPVARATIQHAFMRRTPYNTEDAPGGSYNHERDHVGHFTNFIFGQRSVSEIRNLRKVSWTRSTDQDAAECTLTILNTDVAPIGNTVERQEPDFDLPGQFTYNRGTPKIAVNRWGYDEDTGWNNLAVPDRVVKTYEGYGCDDTVPPGDDPNLYLTGTWLIDEVTYSASGDLQIECRDFARLLLDHIAVPPVIPWGVYPISWDAIRSDQVQGRTFTGGDYHRPKMTCTSSNDLYVGAGISDKPAYVGVSGGVQGHQDRDPIRDDNERFWLSTGQEDPDNFVWWEAEFDTPKDMAGIKLTTVGGPYKIYVSIQREGRVTWEGKRKIPYKVGTEDVNLQGGIRFIHTETLDRGVPIDVVFKRKYRDVKRVRVTFTKLRRFAGQKYPWRAGLRNIWFYTGAYDDLGFGQGEVTKAVGNYNDYTDVVKWAAAWCGFWWPERDDENWINYSTNGEHVHYDYEQSDPALPIGRVWGTFQNTGTHNIKGAFLSHEQFDKQPLMDMINYVRDITGFVFMVDEVAGIVWRMPNLYEQGNYVTHDHKHNRTRPTRTNEYVTIDETDTLLDYSTKLSSRNMRERIFVGDAAGKVGACVRGYNPYKTGLRRVAGWTDQNWKTNKECRVAADMIVARQMFDFRRSSTRIWGNPEIQLDDQIRIFERVTNETFFHYVLGITSELDNEAGTWEYQLTTHWLGERLSDAWVVNPEVLETATQQYMHALGGVDDD